LLLIAIGASHEGDFLIVTIIFN